jgi:hypothetical protein
VDRGVYSGTYELGGTPRIFMTHANIGGRVMCANNKPVTTKSAVNNDGAVDPDLLWDDFDGVSLYPSSMDRLGEDLGGFLMGEPKVWHPDVDLSSVTSYTLKVRITKVGRHLVIPVTCKNTVNGGRDWSNDLVGQVMIRSKIMLEEMVLRQGIECEIIQGFYWSDGRNPKIQEVIQELFNDRIAYKNERDADGTKRPNPMQAVCKLMMNSAYGRTMMRAPEVEAKYVDKDNLLKFIDQHYNDVRISTPLGNGSHRVELKTQIDEHFNRVHIANDVLDMSKRIMNEVTELAQDIGAKIIYTDTDSTHIERAKIPLLADAFRARYGREIIGEEMGQMNCDFDDLADYDEDAGVSVFSTQSIILGKKAYCDVLQDTLGNTGIHFKMKGIKNKSIRTEADRLFNGSIPDLYKYLGTGKPLWFEMSSFRRTKARNMETVMIRRKVQFSPAGVMSVE